jgi:hypothetical protein
MHAHYCSGFSTNRGVAIDVVAVLCRADVVLWRAVGCVFQACSS